MNLFMKRLLSLSLVLTLPFLLAMGQSPQVEDTRESYAVIDSTKIFSESTVGKYCFSRIQELQKMAEGELAALNQRINEEETDEESRNVRIQVELQAALNKLQGILDQDKAAVISIFETAFTSALKKIREKHNISLILSKESVLIYDSSVDLTNEVLAELNSMSITFPLVPDVSLPKPEPIIEEAVEEMEEAESTEANKE